MGTVARRHFAHAGLEEISSLRLVVPLSPDDPGTWDRTAVEPTTCSSEGQNHAEPDTLDAEAECLDFAQTCRESAYVLFDPSRPGRKIPKCFRDM